MEVKKIIDYFGLDHQQRKFAEENFELQQAITEFGTSDNFENNKDKLEHIVEEIADNYVLLLQFIEYFNIDYKQIDEMCKYKVQRTLDRIKGK